MTDNSFLSPTQTVQEPKKREPWRRFFARQLDSILYTTLWYIFLTLVMNINIGNAPFIVDLLSWLVTSLLMLFLEPLFLSCFAATFGKWILGIRVTHYSGRKLTYKEALSRTWKVFVFGLGMSVPVLSFVCMFLCFLKSDAREPLKWEDEEGSMLTLKDKKRWRIFLYIVVFLVISFSFLLSLLLAEMPKKRGDITVKQFCENYNRLAAYYGINSEYYLDDEGNWVAKQADDTAVVISVCGNYDPPQFHFTEENGKMTGLDFSFRMQGETVHPSIYRKEMALAVLSFVKAQPSFRMFSNDMTSLKSQIINGYFEDFSFTRNNVIVSCEVEHEGYYNAGEELYDTEESYAFTFSMRKK